MKQKLWAFKLLAVLMLFFSLKGWGQVSMLTTSSYTQNFDGLNSSGIVTWTDNSSITNWYAKRTGTGTSIVADSGSGTGGNLYSYGQTSNSERALGSLGSGNAAAGSFAYGVLLRNNSSVAITDIKISYTLEQWRKSGVTAAQTVAFFYKISSSAITDLQPSSNGTWTAVTALDSSSPINTTGAANLVGNDNVNKVTKTNIAIPSLNLAAGDYIMLKWDDPDHTGSDHGLSIDDVTISWTVTAACSTNAPTSLQFSNTTNSATDISWTGGNATYTNTLEVDDNSDFSSPISGSPFSGVNLTSQALSGLNANTTYYVRVKSNDGTCDSSYLSGSFTTSPLPADHLAFVGVPTSGSLATNISSFTVEARNANNVVDAAYAGNVTVSKVSGSGNITGTLTQPFVNGVATFNDIQFSEIDTYTIAADHGSFTQIVSGNILIMSAPVATAETNLASNSFTANWNTVAGAESYVLDVNKSSLTQGTLTEGFQVSSGLTGSYTTGNVIINGRTWNVTNVSNGNNVGNNSNASAQLQGITNSNIITPILNNVAKIDFYVRSTVASGSMQVNYSTDGGVNWLPAPGSPFTGLAQNTWIPQSITFPTPTAGGTLVQFRRTNGTIYVDDIVIEYADASSTPIAGSPFTITAPTNNYNLSGLIAGENYAYTVKAVKGSNTSAASNQINVTTPVIVYTTSGWSNGTGPSSSDNATIQDPYSGASFTANNLTVNAPLTVGSGVNVTASGVVTNNSTITVADNGNFVQQLGSTYAGLGTLTLSKNSTSTTNIFDLWSSPIASQGMDDIFVTDGSLVREYLTATDTYANVSPTAAFGKGYAVRGTGTDVVANFTGTPNNGTNTFTLNNTLSTPGNNRYNLVGNPYPSNFNLITFYNTNQGDGSTTGITPTMYFYNSSAATDKWGTFNATAGGTWARANAATTETSVKPGQAFFVSARSASTTVSFDNSMRNAAAAIFVNKAATSTTEGKYWLELTAPNNNTTGFAVTYGYGASNNFDLYDSKMMSTGTDAFYTYLGTEKLAIQGRDYFVSTDVVTLGNKHSAAGQYTISLVNKIGWFTAGQPIYLHDKELGTYTDLQTGNYSFTTNALEQQNRFEIVYQTSALGTAENVKAETKVYRDGDYFVVEASEKITGIEVYDASGRLVLTQQPNRMNARLLISSKGMYVIHIKTVKSETSKKVIK